MFNKLPALCLISALAAPACVIVDDDDETATTVSSASSAGSTGATTTASTATDATTTDATTAGSTSTSSSASSSETDETTAGASTGAASNCGWGATGSADVPMGFVCGGDGDDPDSNFDLACPDAVELTEGGECGTITGVGCCDSAGNSWFCADPDGNDPPQLFTENCNE